MVRYPCMKVLSFCTSCFFGDFIEKHYLSFFCVDLFPHCSDSRNSSDYPVTGN